MRTPIPDMVLRAVEERRRQLLGKAWSVAGQWLTGEQIAEANGVLCLVGQWEDKKAAMCDAIDGRGKGGRRWSKAMSVMARYGLATHLGGGVWQPGTPDDYTRWANHVHQEKVKAMEAEKSAERAKAPPILIRVLVAPGVVEYHAMQFPHRALDGDAPTPVMIDPMCVPAGLFEEGLDPEYIRCITAEPLDPKGLGRWFDEWRRWLEGKR